MKEMIGRNLWKRIRPHNTRRKLVWLALIAIAGEYAVCLPSSIFDVPYSTVLEARGGELLSAAIASDGQWRFPEAERVPDKFSEAVIAFEDKRFYFHPGVDVFSLARALGQNIAHGKVVSGGSTLTMQVVRLSRKAPARTILRSAATQLLEGSEPWRGRFID